MQLTVSGIPKVGNEEISIDDGEFDIDYFNGEYLVYSKKVSNETGLYHREIYFEYDFEREERRTFGRFTKRSDMFRKDNTSVFIVEVYELNPRNQSLYDYSVNIYEKDFESRDRNIVKTFNLINLTTYSYEIIPIRDEYHLFRHISNDFIKYVNKTEKFESEGEALEYYILNSSGIFQISKVEYGKRKSFNTVYEDKLFQVTIDKVKNKRTNETFDIEIGRNNFCGISESFLYYNENLYYESAKKPLITLVKLDYKNNVKQRIIVNERCITGDGSFYAKPYIFNLANDNYNYLQSDNGKIVISKSNILVIDEGINYLTLDLSENQASANVEVLEELNETFEEVIEKPSSPNNIKSNSSLDDLEEEEEPEITSFGEKTYFEKLQDQMTPKNIVISLIALEAFVAFIVIIIVFKVLLSKVSKKSSKEKPVKVKEEKEEIFKVSKIKKKSSFKSKFKSLKDDGLSKVDKSSLSEYKREYLENKRKLFKR